MPRRQLVVCAREDLFASSFRPEQQRRLSRLFHGSRDGDRTATPGLRHKLTAVWDQANCFLESGERPQEGASLLGPRVRHVHVKDLRQNSEGWKPALAGDGNFPLPELRSVPRLEYHNFASFEWEKKWHPEIADAKIALPHFTRVVSGELKP